MIPSYDGGIAAGVAVEHHMVQVQSLRQQQNASQVAGSSGSAPFAGSSNSPSKLGKADAGHESRKYPVNSCAKHLDTDFSPATIRISRGNRRPVRLTSSFDCANSYGRATCFGSALQGNKASHGRIREAVRSGFDVTRQPVFESRVSRNRDD